MSPTVLLVERSRLFREAVRVFFQGSAFQLTAEADSIEQALELIRKGVRPDLVILDFKEDDEREVAGVTALRDLLPNARIALLGEDMPKRKIDVAFAIGVDGCVCKNVSAQALCAYLTLTMAGERVLHYELARRRVYGSTMHRSESTSNGGLSAREQDILARIAQGEPNKVIARNLRLTEGTVKVHVKSILRKIEVQNRTQAALWALQNGFGLKGGGDSSGVAA